MHYPLTLTLRPSRRGHVLIAAIHLVAAIAFVRSSLPFALVAGALLLLALSLWHAVAAAHAWCEQTLVLEADGRLVLCSPRGRVEAWPVAGADFAWAVWVSWRAEGGQGLRARRGARMLLPDQCAAAEWRALRAWLRHKAVAAQPDAPQEASGRDRS